MTGCAYRPSLQLLSCQVRPYNSPRAKSSLTSSLDGIRAYTPLKLIGDGSFGTVWLCDWHSPLPPGTPLSPMQCGQGAKLRPEWTGKRLVAVKRLNRRWNGGWDECCKLKELESLRRISPHASIIPLYDAFLLPSSLELYFVFESMEGNLYQLIKARKTRPFAAGLIASIFKQTIAGLEHMHDQGYFHRDMKPENLLVTTTGVAEYGAVPGRNGVYRNGTSASQGEKDVQVIVKLADFGLAREILSEPPYTEYVSTRWYRAPEILLRATDYSAPVDLWAFGTIMAELVNLRPLFPGSGELDQLGKLCDMLGDFDRDYAFDERGVPIGGGAWPRAASMLSRRGY
ncbi:kinase-like protein, partial [Dacryopinax primogenitus]